MSGAHDQARDAAEKLYRHLKSGFDGHLELYQDEIETIAEYLGVKEKE